MNEHETFRQRLYEQYSSEKMAGWRDAEEKEYRRWALAAGSRLAGWLPEDKGAFCLDLGCGPGNVLFLLQQEGYRQISGVDVSAQQLEVARRVCPNVIQADLREYLDKWENAFDLITAFDVIEHFKKNEVLSVLSAIKKALKPGGTLILQTPNAESPWGFMHRCHDFTHEVAFDPHCLEHILTVVGFDTIEARECGPYVHGAKSFLRFIVWKWIWGVLALWNLAETGSLGSGIYTRVFVAKAHKPDMDVL